ncbi:MAG: ParB/RepB/Spo0J family partition protein [Acholeplasmataceae bacterium]
MKDRGRTLYDLLQEHHVDDVLDGELIDEIRLTEIRPNPFQPRRVFDREKINELAQSINEHGIFQPLILKKVKDHYIIVSGERRFRAAQSLELESVPAIIRQYEETKVAEIALAENLQRENLTAIEEAEAYRFIIDRLSITQSQLANRIGKSRSHVTNMLGLLELPEIVKDMLLRGDISMGHARVLSKLDDEDRIIELANAVIRKQLNVRQLEELASRERRKRKTSPARERRFYEQEKQLTERLGYPTRIEEERIVIRFDKEERNEIIEKLMKK